MNASETTIAQYLTKLGILINLNTGNLKYAQTFTPLQLNYELIFIRHGETFGNCGQITAKNAIDFELVNAKKKNKANRIFQGNVDTIINQLTTYGKSQALEVAHLLEKKFEKTVPDVIFHSPFKRALETALPYIHRNHLIERFKVLPDLRELSFGAWDNRRVCDIPAADIAHRFYKEQHALVKCSGINGDGQYQIGENFSELLLRAHKVLTELNEHYHGKRIIFFSHSMFGAACAILLGKGQIAEGKTFLAFDGQRADGSFYTLPNAVPIYW